MAVLVKPVDNFRDVWARFAQHCAGAVFLGGSIEMGVAEDWQTRVTNSLQDLPIMILNPRRDDWDSSWEQDPTPGTKFHEQVSWELEGQEFCDTLIYYFHPDTKAPITMMELGLYAGWSQDTFVYCPKEFWRYGNVKMVCDRYNLHFFEDEGELITAVREHLCRYIGPK